MPRLDLNNSVTSVVDRNRGTVTAIQTEIVQENGRTITRTNVSETNIDDIPVQLQQNPVPMETDTPIVEPPGQDDEINGTNDDINVEQRPELGMSRRPMRLRTRGPSNSVSLRMTESELLSDVLFKGAPAFRLLSETWATASPKLRVSHIAFKKRLFGVMTAQVSDYHDISHARESIARNPKRFGAVFWQTSTSPPKAIIVTLYYKTLHEGNDREPLFHAVCSCSPTHDVCSVDRFCCEHVTEVLKETTVTDYFRTILHPQSLHSISTSKFGDPLVLSDPYPSVHLLSAASTAGTNTTNSAGKHSFYAQFDSDRNLFCPLVKIPKKPVHCLLCRRTSNKRGLCPHEVHLKASIEDEDTPSDFDDTDFDYFESQTNGLLQEDESLRRSEIRKGHSTVVRNNDIANYCRTDLKLPLLPCSEIRRTSYELGILLQDCRGARSQHFYDFYGSCRYCLYQRGLDWLPKHHSHWRRTKLFTLCQRIQVITVEDWTCPSCFKLVRFCGTARAIFPVRKTYAFTYELLYYFVNNVCRLGISFRAQYDSYHMAQVSQSAQAIMDDFSGDFYAEMEECSSGRRRCAEAFSLFLACIDTNNAVLCDHLFTCKDCEKTLTVEEKRLLGFSNNHTGTVKRYKCIAIDGTTAGILHKLPTYERISTTLSVRTELQKDQRAFTSKLYKKTILSLKSVIRSRLRAIVGRLRNYPFHTDRFKFLIPTLKSKKSQAGKKYYLDDDQLLCVRRLLCNERCFCSLGPTPTNRRRKHSERCRRASRACQSTVPTLQIHQFICEIMSLERQTRVEEEVDDYLPPESDTSEEDIVGEGGVYVPEEDAPVAYRTRHRASLQENAIDTSAEDSLDAQSEDVRLPQSHHDQQPSNSQRNNENRDRQHVSSRTVEEWFITVNIPNPRRCGLLIESFLELLQFFLTDNVSIPYVRPCSDSIQRVVDSDQWNDEMNLRSTRLFNEDGTVKQDPETIAHDSFLLHSRLRGTLHEFASCRCNNRSISNDPCSNCKRTLAKSSSLLDDINPICAMFVDQLVLHSHLLEGKVRGIATCFSNALEEHGNNAKTYFNNLISNMAPDCKNYWNNYASCLLPSLPTEQDLQQQINEDGSPVRTGQNNSETRGGSSQQEHPENDDNRQQHSPQPRRLSENRGGSSQLHNSEDEDNENEQSLHPRTLSDNPTQQDHQTTVGEETPQQETINDNELTESRIDTQPDIMQVDNSTQRRTSSNQPGEDQDNSTQRRISSNHSGEDQNNISNDEHNINSDLGDSARTQNADLQQEQVPDRSWITGMSFPGRVQRRPLIIFDQLEGHQCGKRYAQNTNHSPGLLTAQCACGNPKYIGFIVMMRAESTSLALAIILMFFHIPPEIVLYDNACNCLASALLRIPWLLMFSFLIVDRFHYKGHSCNAFFDADRYKKLDTSKTSASEILNSKLKRSLYNMRFVAGETLVHYLNVRLALLNLNAKYYELHQKADMEDINVDEFYASLFQCSCRTSLFMRETSDIIRENQEGDDTIF